MSLFRAPSTFATERRAMLRTRVECPAQLHLSGGMRPVTMVDLSESGAKLQSDNPPKPGVAGLLKWGPHEAFGQVVWVTGDTCGVKFDRPIERGVVLETVELEEQPSGPVAAVGNIPIGKKRSRP